MYKSEVKINYNPINEGLLQNMEKFGPVLNQMTCNI